MNGFTDHQVLIKTRVCVSDRFKMLVYLHVETYGHFEISVGKEFFRKFKAKSTPC